MLGHADRVDPQNKRPGSKTARERGGGLPRNLETVMTSSQSKLEARKLLCENVKIFESFWEALDQAALWPDHFNTIQGRRMIDKIKAWNAQRRQTQAAAGTTR